MDANLLNPYAAQMELRNWNFISYKIPSNYLCIIHVFSKNREISRFYMVKYYSAAKGI